MIDNSNLFPAMVWVLTIKRFLIICVPRKIHVLLLWTCTTGIKSNYFFHFRMLNQERKTTTKEKILVLVSNVPLKFAFRLLHVTFNCYLIAVMRLQLKYIKERKKEGEGVDWKMAGFSTGDAENRSESCIVEGLFSPTKHPEASSKYSWGWMETLQKLRVDGWLQGFGNFPT